MLNRSYITVCHGCVTLQVEYTIDLTKEGYEKANTGGGYYGHQSGYSHESGSHYA